MINKTLGGDRLGSGKKMKVELNHYERSTHDLSYLFRSTMSAGTLVPFMNKVALPGDTWDINLDAEIMTHPTIGPLFGSMKVQLDIFITPMRIWNGLLQNNKVGMGLKMNKAFLPQMILAARQVDLADETDIDNCQINPSCILSYLGLRGIGNNDASPDVERSFNAVALLTYWDTVKCYYTNKMEDNAYVIHNSVAIGGAIAGTLLINGAAVAPEGTYVGSGSDTIEIGYAAAVPAIDYIEIEADFGSGKIWVPALNIGLNWTNGGAGPSFWLANFNASKYGQATLYAVRQVTNSSSIQASPRLVAFPVENLDLIKEAVSREANLLTPVDINSTSEGALPPYMYVVEPTDYTSRLSSQEGLAVKTYQSDLFNNWLNTEYIDGPGGINEITAIDTSGGSFNIDTLILANKVYDMLNRIMVSGGTYNDWQEVVYTHDRVVEANTPVYMGGLIKELVFQEVISNANAEGQPLGTLGGRGVLSNKHKGGNIYIKVNEISYIQGFISITPRIDNSQGNEWDITLETFDDFHKPALDQIGFQDLITERLAWWTTEYNGTTWVQKTVGKQPAWIEYMTSVNKTFGNFAIRDNEMFMTLNRRYEPSTSPVTIDDLTTYIDPVKFNHIFADTSLDAQNFWTQIAVNITCRRKMGAKIMPNL